MTDNEFKNFCKVCIAWDDLKTREKIMCHIEKLDLMLLEKVSNNLDYMYKAIGTRHSVRHRLEVTMPDKY